jgi:hypothetical protein
MKRWHRILGITIATVGSAVLISFFEKKAIRVYEVWIIWLLVAIGFEQCKNEEE